MSLHFAVALLLCWLVLPNSLSALSLRNQNKSGIRLLAADLVQKQSENTIYLVNPDYLGPTFGYYMRKHQVKLQGFARWQNPEIFRPQGYAKIWEQPTLISDIEQRLQEEARKGYRELALIQENLVLEDVGQMKYSRANVFLSRLK